MPGQLALPSPSPPGLGFAITHHSLLSGFLSIEGSQGFHPEDRREIVLTDKIWTPRPVENEAFDCSTQNSVRLCPQYTFLSKCMDKEFLNCKIMYLNYFASIESALWKITSPAETPLDCTMGIFFVLFISIPTNIPFSSSSSFSGWPWDTPEKGREGYIKTGYSSWNLLSDLQFLLFCPIVVWHHSLGKTPPHPRWGTNNRSK